jgi:hypothetical protein
MDQLKDIFEPAGYNHPQYARSLEEYGDPRELPCSGGWVLERSIPDTIYRDAMGCYPLFFCRDWERIGEDLEDLRAELVSIVLVTDPFAEASHEHFERCFDFVKPFKRHFIADLSCAPKSYIPKGHFYTIRKSLKQMEVEICEDPIRYLEDWIRLYDGLIERHGIKGIRRFSRKCFTSQLRIPGTILAVGKIGGEVVGADLVIVQNEVAYAHLGAYSPPGYKVGASYGTVWRAMEYLMDHGVRYFDLGGVAGFNENPEDGLVRYKAGWSNMRKTAYLCGSVFDEGKYESICAQKNVPKGNYFPLYRAGEFA